MDSQLKRKETGEAFLDSLYKTVIGAGDSSLQALEELSSIALGGHEQARRLVNDIDTKVMAGELKLPVTVKLENTQL